MIEVFQTIYVYGIVPAFFIFAILAFIFYKPSHVSILRLTVAAFIWPVAIGLFVCICIADIISGK